MSKSFKPKPTDSYKIKIKVLKALLECPKTYGQIAEEIDCKIRDVQSALRDMDCGWTTELKYSMPAIERKYKLIEDGRRRAEVFRDIDFFDWSDERFVKNLVKRDVDVLIKQLEQGSFSAPAELAEIGDPSAVDPLIRAMSTHRGSDKIPFAKALGELGGGSAVIALSGALEDEWDRRARIEIITALGMAGGESAAKALIRQLTSFDLDTRFWARHALSKMGSMVFELLYSFYTQKLREFTDFQQCVGDLINGINDREAVNQLVSFLERGDAFLREHAASSLGRMGDKLAVEPLVQALHDKNRKVRTAVTRALGQIGDIGVVDRLAKALQDEDEEVRKSAEEALKKINERQNPTAEP